MKTYILRENPKFKITLLEDSIKIEKDENHLNDQIYLYNELISFKVVKKMETFTYYFLKFMFLNLYRNPKNPSLLNIKTTKSEQDIHLKGLDVEKMEEILKYVNQRIVNKVDTVAT